MQDALDADAVSLCLFDDVFLVSRSPVQWGHRTCLLRK
jgi:hypothetical protein